MSKSYWFKPKSYGFGFRPTSWQGWVAVLFLVAIILFSFQLNGLFELDKSLDKYIFGRMILDVFLITGAFHAIFRDYIDGEVRWRWGK